MTNRERLRKTILYAFERQLKESDDESLAIMAEDLIYEGYCEPVFENLYYFDEIHKFLQKEGDKEEDEDNL